MSELDVTNVRPDAGTPSMQPPQAPQNAPLPPGSSGFPLLGQTLPFLKDMFGFIRRGMIAHGSIFRANILNQDAVFIAGPSACERWLDQKLVTRENSLPPPVATLFGGRSVALLDGEEHKVRKQLLLTAFSPQARAGYLPVLQALIDAHLARWVAAGEIDWVPALKKLGFEGIAATIFGLAPSPEVDGLFDDYGLLLAGFSALPIRLPGTTFSKAVAARDRILAFFEKTIAARRSVVKPTDTDGLALLLAARTPAEHGGQGLGDRDLALELHHVVIAGYIVFAELVGLVTAFTAHPKVREQLAAEVRAKLPGGTPTLAQLEAMPYLTQVVMEVKRFCPNVAVSFGRARETFELDGVRIPKGWQIFMSVGENNRAAYTNPDNFDPDRFSSTRAEHLRNPHAFVPQGAGKPEDHKCLGYDFTTHFMQLFAVALARDCSWEILTKDLSLRWDVVPPVPKHGLRSKVARA
jgi:cytochrome P450